MRISKTEFISCPSCGRTLFNLCGATDPVEVVCLILHQANIQVENSWFVVHLCMKSKETRALACFQPEARDNSKDSRANRASSRCTKTNELCTRQSQARCPRSNHGMHREWAWRNGRCRFWLCWEPQYESKQVASKVGSGVGK